MLKMRLRRINFPRQGPRLTSRHCATAFNVVVSILCAIEIVTAAVAVEQLSAWSV